MFTLLFLICRRIKFDWWWYRELLLKLWRVIKPFLTWRILVIYLPIWFIVSGWAVAGVFIGRGWFRAISITWQAILWMPWCPEKLLTIPLTIWIHKKIFPKHSTSSLEKALEKEKQLSRRKT